MIVCELMNSVHVKKYSHLLRLIGIFILFGLMVGGVLFLDFPDIFVKSRSNSVVENPCVPIQSSLSNKTVILRVDDIQGYAWSETSEKMIIDAEALGIPLTLGVIPAGLTDDTELVSFLKNHGCSVEFAQHGLTHHGGKDGSLPEFGTSSKNEAYSLIQKGRDILKNITNDLIVSWIPPLNEHSQGTIDALRELGFTHLSSEGEGTFDYDAATFRYDTNVLVSPEEVIKSCIKTFKTSTYCVVMLHPQDFADGLAHDQEKYKRYYLDLLDGLMSEGVTFSRLKDIPL